MLSKPAEFHGSEHFQGLDVSLPDCNLGLAASGVPIAEELVMSWGGWNQNVRRRETFCENHLSPNLVAIAAAVTDALALHRDRIDDLGYRYTYRLDADTDLILARLELKEWWSRS